MLFSKKQGQHAEKRGDMSEKNGKLILLSTPIGNLQDMTQRGLMALNQLLVFLAEDTRHFKSLFNALDISLDQKKIYSFHDHSDDKQLLFIEELLAEGDVCLVSDAGSPIISDPAYKLVDHLLKRGYEVDTFPGVSSVTAALELSGLPPHPFTFYGFLPRDKEGKQKWIGRFRAQGGTHLFFESPHRIESSMDFLCQELPDVEFALCRELTKKFQSVYRFKGDQWEECKSSYVFKGEFVVALYIPETEQESSVLSSKLVKQAEKVLKSQGKKREWAKLLSQILGQDSKDIYNQVFGEGADK